MRKIISAYIVVASAFAGCSATQSLVHKIFPYTSHIVIPASGSNMPMETTGPASNFDQVFSVRGTDARKVNAIRIASAKIAAGDPGHSLGRFKSVKMYISVGNEGADEVLVASLNDISPYAGNHLTLDLHSDKTVSVGYGSAKRKDVTGSIGSIDPDKLKDLPVSRVDQAISGKLAGVQVVGNGDPGAASQIRIRGVSSLLAGRSPLYVIDGIPTDNIHMLNPNDIESIDVLKDASSTSIYGSRGANGVILISTKTGKSESDSGFLQNYVKGSTMRIRLEYVLRYALRSETSLSVDIDFIPEFK